MDRGFRWVMLLAMLIAWQACPAKDPEIWIAPRTDGQKGRGTIDDPYDGSSQVKFDRVLRGYWWRGTKHLTVHLSAGTFETVGQWRLHARTHQRNGGLEVQYRLDSWPEQDRVRPS